MPLFGLFGPPNVEKLKATGDVKGLIKILVSEKNNQIVIEAAEALGTLKNAQAVEALLALLSHDEMAVRRVAAQSLGSFAGSQAIPDLVALLKDKHKDVRQMAVWSLGQIGGPQSVAPLISMLADRASIVRQTASLALAKTADQRAIEPLLALLHDKDLEVRIAANKALETLEWQPADGMAQVERALATQSWEQLHQIGKPAVAQLLAALNKADPAVLVNIADVLGRIGDSRAILPLVGLTVYDNSKVRNSALRALEQLMPETDEQKVQRALALKRWPEAAQTGPLAVGPLIQAFHRSESEAQRAILEALGAIGDGQAIETLALLVTENRPSDLRRTAAEALEKLSPQNEEQKLKRALALRKWDELASLGPVTVEPLLRLLRDPALTSDVAKILGKIGDSRAIIPLADILIEKGDLAQVAEALSQLAPGNEDHRLYQAIARQRWNEVESFGAAAVGGLMRVLLQSTSQTHRQGAVQVLIQINSEKSVPGLIKALKDRNGAVAAQAASALAEMGRAEAVEALIQCLDHSQPEAKRAAISALVQLQAQGASWKIIGLLYGLDVTVCVSAAEALGKLKNPDALKPLLSCLDNQDIRLRAAAIIALGQLDDINSVKAIVTAREDSAPKVRQAATSAFSQLKARLRPSDRLWASLAMHNWRLAVEFGTAAVEPLIALLQAESREVRHGALSALREIGDGRACDSFIVCLKDEDPAIRASAAGGLGELGDGRAATPLCGCLEDPERSVSQSAEHALVQLGSAAVEPMAGLLEHEKLRLREMAARILGKIGDVGGMMPLLKSLNDSGRNVRAAAAHSLGEIGNFGAVEGLIAVSTDPEPRVRFEAINALSDFVREVHVIDALKIAPMGENWEICQSGDKALEPWEQSSDPTNYAGVAVSLQHWDAAEHLGRYAVKPLVGAVKTDKASWIPDALTALQRIMERVANEVPIEELESIRDFPPTLAFVISYWSSDCGGIEKFDTHKADSSVVRQLARQELIRRGEQA